ncbi:MAG: proton-conducting transporter transmembrane domain-containing protein [Candidatus Flexifilum sp.]
MENYPLLVTLIILIPSIGAFINLFWGARMGEKMVGSVATIASALSFVIAVLLYIYLVNSNYEAVVVNPPLLDGWIRLGEGSVNIPWQQRVDTLSVTMMLIVTGVGSLIHLYCIGYMHGDEKVHRFFAYMNMFLAFMLVLVTGNNLLMLFVGWEGVGLCSYLLIGFWFDKAKGIGWRNSNAARKAMIVNRIGDFGLLMAIFLTFWTFGTLDFYTPQEVVNPAFAAGETLGHDHEADAAHSTGETHDSGTVTGHKLADVVIGQEGGHGETDTHAATAETAAHGESDMHGEPTVVYVNNDHIPTEQLGIFGQAERFLAEGREVDLGPFSLPIGTVITLITLFMLIGATGKSAQIPLFVWLPDAMAGPTPASALIHAATMVTAGVYMMVRANVFFYEAELTSFIVALVGVGTALVGGFIALGQWDIKRVLAYSTVSQLGFMVAAVGIGAYGAAIFHLVTHAFFKALLFLASGSVIHGMEHGHHSALHRKHAAHGHGDHHGHDEDHDFDPQDMRNMGGLARKMPITYITYLAGTLALAGIFPFAGFWSKDEILLDAWILGFEDGKIIGFIALGGLLVAAAFTAFYMWRQVVMVFHGSPRTEAADHASESVPTMTIPLVVLGIMSLLAGFMNTPTGVLGLDGVFGAHMFSSWLYPSVVHVHVADFNVLIALGATVLAVAAIIAANSIYARAGRTLEARRDPLQDIPSTAPIFSIANARMYWDDIYNRVIEQPFNRTGKFLADTVDWAFLHDYFHETVIYKGFNTIGRLLANPVDLGIIDGIVNGVGRVARFFSSRLRTVQTGYVRTYAISLLLGVVLVILILLLPLINNG